MRSPRHVHRSLHQPLHRRHFLTFAGIGAAATLTGARAALAAEAPARSGWGALVERAREAMIRHDIANRDRFVVVDFSLPSSVQRMLLVDNIHNKRQLVHVAHGRGSDPEHSGWLHRFSNISGSNASSRGAYVTGPTYVGAHGRSQRLIGLEETNDNAHARAIVIHGAWYCNDEVLRRSGKLGRSEGCFAVSEDRISPLLDWLGEGRLLYADKV